MKMLMFGILDVKVGAFKPPVFMLSRAQAWRAFGDLCLDKENEFGRHPQDYEFCLLGEFDDQTGEIKQVDRETFGRGDKAIAVPP